MSGLATSLLLFVSSCLALSSAHDTCGSFSWDQSALQKYCSTPGQEAYRSPACSVFRLCSGAASPPLGRGLCATERLLITLCVDQPGLPECTGFKAAFSQAADHGACLAAKSLKAASTSAAVGHMRRACSPDSTLPGCDQCNAVVCETSDPLLAYAAACTHTAAEGCEAHAALCAQEGSASAQVLCLPPRLRAAATHSSIRAADAPPTPDPCVLDSSAPACAAYTYPDASALEDIARLCGSMPDMPGCAIEAACDKHDGSVSERYCRPFTVLGTLCGDMPGMRGCESYKALCVKPGSVVAQCTQQPPIPGAPTWSQARKAVFSACDDHPMEGCSACSKGDCPDPLGSLSAICHEMPNMAVCRTLWGFCDAAGPEDLREWCAEDSSRYLPSMIMYFHQRVQELILWKEWRPMNTAQYAASIVAIVAMGVLATGLKTAKGALALQWAHDRALAGEAPVPASIWLPSGEQVRETAIKSGIMGVSLTIDYFNMLIAMTFNVGLFAAVIAGYVVGSLLFTHVLENYGAILHHRRKQHALLVRRTALSRDGTANGDVEAGVALLAGGKGGKASTSAAGLSSDEDSEEQFRLQAEEAECNCVHSA
ncbi:hypothetical protein HYH03_006686 [Edaphochlamys debaryana]|uniref:Copper transporter n=1 Tax=Edaphochlamys debaryana TaxID=47281 RepID=A0A835Y325_9CHLO|nr:hypothetical protein HYH03_006686 [Edaphochlamys debaryana]|eukprot:KAG2495075.1 hypothetical protein HYH03_006686 [Edaphochlamys debaryana]